MEKDKKPRWSFTSFLVALCSGGASFPLAVRSSSARFLLAVRNGGGGSRSGKGMVLGMAVMMAALIRYAQIMRKRRKLCIFDRLVTMH